MKTIQSKLLLLFIVMTLLPVIGVGWYAYKISVKAAQDNAGRSLQSSLEQMGKNLDFQMKLYKKYMDVIATSEEIQSILFQNSFDPSKVETMIANNRLDNIMNSLFFPEGSPGLIALYKNNNYLYSYKSTTDSTLLELGNSDMYQSDMLYEGSIRLHTMIIANSESGVSHNYFIMGRRLLDRNKRDAEGNNAGVYLFVDEKYIYDILNSGGSNSQGKEMNMVSNRSGKILFQSNMDKKGGVTANEFVTNIPENQIAGSYTETINGSNMIVGYYKLPQWDLQVVRMVPQADFTENIRSIRSSTVLISCLLFIVLVFVSWLLAKRLSEPVRTLVAAMRQMQSGDFNVRIDRNFDQEFNILSSSFNYMAIRLKDAVDKLVDEERRRGEIEYQMLQYQINPHFVNNAIGSVRMYAMAEGADRVAEVLQVLGRLFQRTLGGTSRFVKVRTEISNLKDFIQLERMQYLNHLEVEFKVPEVEMEYLIPHLLLQPLVENAIFHGFNRHVKHPKILIAVEKKGEDLHLILQDNGVGMTKEKLHEVMDQGSELGNRLNRIGIKNVDQRLKLVYGEPYGLALSSVPGEGTTAVITIPARKEKAGRSPDGELLAHASREDSV
ncbi:MAG: histidine kinase [Paenibacillaceae bacterium]|nr:histidine kinase [Paenibacillaceae bacterium]